MDNFHGSVGVIQRIILPVRFITIDRFRSTSRESTFVFLEIWTNPENRQMCIIIEEKTKNYKKLLHPN